jgi:hypothetical protein
MITSLEVSVLGVAACNDMSESKNTPSVRGVSGFHVVWNPW